MDNARTHLIQIDWDGPYKLNELDTLQNDEIDYGIYQLYGKHLTYGSDVLLYIGKADQQTFGRRISQESWDYINDYKNIKVYIGRLHGSQSPNYDEWLKEIALPIVIHFLYIYKQFFCIKVI